MTRVVFVVTDSDPTADDFDFDAEMAPTVAQLRMLLAEAGYPQAHVYNEASGIFVEGVPEDVKQRAFDLVGQRP